MKKMCYCTGNGTVQFVNIKILKEFAGFYIWIIRGMPLLVQLFIIFYGLPNPGIVLPPFPSAVIVFSICGYALDGKALLLFVGYQWITQGETVTIPEEVLCKAIQIKDCRASDSGKS